jgi:hypothetical protein
MRYGDRLMRGEDDLYERLANLPFLLEDDSLRPNRQGISAPDIAKLFRSSKAYT